MTIYKVLYDNINTISDVLSISENPAPSDYLLNVTDADLNHRSSQDNILINLTANNFSFTEAIPQEILDNGNVTKQVSTDIKGRYYVNFDNAKYYIPHTVTAITSPIQEIFKFHINPIRVTPSNRKINNEIRTRGGWEIQHWGNELTDLKIEAATGAMTSTSSTKSVDTILTSTQSIIDSYAWRKVADLRSIYENDHKNRNTAVKNLLGITYYDSFLIGYFTNFDGPIADADKPYIMYFSFGFKVQQSIYLNNTNILSNINSEN